MWRIPVLLAVAALAACTHPGYASYSSFGIPFAQGDAACSRSAPKDIDLSLYGQCMRLSGY
jgi:hypothetical protein